MESLDYRVENRKLFVSFPSPCGEVVMESIGNTHWAVIGKKFPSPCGEVVMESQSVPVGNGRACGWMLVSIPLRGSGYGKG